MKTTPDSPSKVLDDLEELVKSGKAEIEPVYYSAGPGGSTGTSGSSSSAHHGGGGSGNNGHQSGGGGGTNGGNSSNNQHNKLRRGKAYRYVENNEFFCFVSSDNVVYRPGDCVYVDSQRSDQPYFVAGIQGYKMTKRDQLNVLIKWYYRPCEIPESVYRTLVQDRHSENNSAGVGGTSICLKDPLIQSRELFISDAIDTYPISAIRGKCVVYHLKDIGTTARDTKKLTQDDSFFYVLGYNPENNRLASILGEIRVGPSHQARLPEFKDRERDGNGSVLIAPEDDKVRETLVWLPESLADNDILMYLRAARSMAVFAGMCHGGSTEDACLAAPRDQTTINAYDSLHENTYNTGLALEDLMKNPVPLSTMKKWTDDETKKFVRGLKQYGKNFFKIRHELLPHKETCELIEFYYLWKKTAAASSQRPRQRQRRPQTTILRRVKPAPGGKPSRPASNEFLDLSSASENESDSDSSDTKDLSSYACHHCYTTTSKNWHHAGKDRALLCVDCRLHFKKYGELRPVDRSRTPPPFLFTPVKEVNGLLLTESNINHHLNSAAGVKTRRGNKNAAAAASAAAVRRKTLTPTAEMEKHRSTNNRVSSPVGTGPNQIKREKESSPNGDKKSPKSKSQKRKLPPENGGGDSSNPATPSKVPPPSATTVSCGVQSSSSATSVGEQSHETGAPGKKKTAIVAPNVASMARNRATGGASESSSLASGCCSSSSTSSSTTGNEGDTEMRDENSSPSAPSTPLINDAVFDPSGSSSAPNPVTPQQPNVLNPVNTNAVTDASPLSVSVAPVAESGHVRETGTPATSTAATPTVAITPVGPNSGGRVTPDRCTKSAAPVSSSVDNPSTTVYNFKEDDMLAQSLGQYRRRLMEINQQNNQQQTQPQPQQTPSINNTRSNNSSSNNNLDSPVNNNSILGASPFFGTPASISSPGHNNGNPLNSASNSNSCAVSSNTAAPQGPETAVVAPLLMVQRRAHSPQTPQPPVVRTAASAGVGPAPSLITASVAVVTPTTNTSGMSCATSVIKQNHHQHGGHGHHHGNHHHHGYQGRHSQHSQHAGHHSNSHNSTFPSKITVKEEPQDFVGSAAPSIGGPISAGPSTSSSMGSNFPHFGNPMVPPLTNNSVAPFSSDSAQNRSANNNNSSDSEDENDNCHGGFLLDRSLIPGVKEPEPKVDDTECHRSAHAIFRRHWYRGESNSCSRTDLVFIPLPDSLLAKKREENLRLKPSTSAAPVVTVKEEKKDRPPSSHQQHRSSSRPHFPLPSPHQQHPTAVVAPNSGGPSSADHASSSGGGFLTPSTPYPPFPPSVLSSQNATPVPGLMGHLGTPGLPFGGPNPGVSGSAHGGGAPGAELPYLQRLKEMANAAAQTTPGTPAFYQAALIDPLLQRNILSGVYGPVEKERLEMELRERQQELLHRDYELATKAMFPHTPTPMLPGGSLLGPSSSVPPGPIPSVGLPTNQANLEHRQWLAAAAAAAAAVSAGGGTGPFSPSNNAALAAAAMGLTPTPILSSSAGAAGSGGIPGLTTPGALPTDLATLERCIAGLSAQHLQLERINSMNPNNPQVRLEMERIAGQLAALAAAAAGATQHHTHSHTHSHTHLHIHPSTCSSVVNPTAGQSETVSAPTSSSHQHHHHQQQQQQQQQLHQQQQQQQQHHQQHQSHHPLHQQSPHQQHGSASSGGASGVALPLGHPSPGGPHHPFWASSSNPLLAVAAGNPAEALYLAQYAAMFRPNNFVDALAFGGGFPPFPGVFPPGFAVPPQAGMDPLVAERLQQLQQQQEMQRRMILDREQMIASQQLVQHNEMMRRLQQEGNSGFPAILGIPNSLQLTNAGFIRPSPSPFEKR